MGLLNVHFLKPDSIRKVLIGDGLMALWKTSAEIFNFVQASLII